MSRFTCQLVHLLAVLCLTANTFAWAAHVDTPAPASASAAEAEHAHLDNGDLVDRCDHCCHSGAHLLALTPGMDIPVAGAPAVALERPVRTPLETHSDPPFIPPIA